MTKLPQLKALKIIKALNRAGFVETRSVGSHLRLAHPDGWKITIAIHPKPIPQGTLKSILRQAEMSFEEFKKFIK